MSRDIPVGAAYHSPHMASAVGPLGAALDAAPFVDARIPVVANVDARLHTAASERPTLLRDQVTGPVRWRESVLAIRGAALPTWSNRAQRPTGSDDQRIDPSLGCTNVITPNDLETS